MYVGKLYIGLCTIVKSVAKGNSRRIPTHTWRRRKLVKIDFITPGNVKGARGGSGRAGCAAAPHLADEHATAAGAE